MDQATNQPVELLASVEGTKLTISGPISSPREQAANTTTRFNKRAIFTGCNAAQMLLINQAAIAATKYVEDTNAYTQALIVPTPRFITWFKVFNSQQKNAVATVFQTLQRRNDFSGEYTYDCTFVGCPATWFAYVVKSRRVLDFLSSLRLFVTD